jgi:putative transposase
MIAPEERQMAMKLIDEAMQQGARLEPACAVVGLTARTIQRWRSQERCLDRRTETVHRPANKLSEQERQHIIDVANEPRFSALPPSQIVPRLADEGRYIASESSFYRVLSEANQLHHRGQAKPRNPSPAPKGHCASGPCQVWSWDITYLRTVVAGQFFYLYLMLDIYSRKIVGWEVHEVERAELAGELLKRATLAEAINSAMPGPVLHSDNGSPMKGATMLATMQSLGVVPSFSRPSVSNDNPFSESLFRTLKGGPSWPEGPFESLDSARQWVHGFVQWYNHEHRHSAIGFVTPVQRHDGEDEMILARRKAVYEEAKQRNPVRWSGHTRDWKACGEVWLNPPASVGKQQACQTSI